MFSSQGITSVPSAWPASSAAAVLCNGGVRGEAAASSDSASASGKSAFGAPGVVTGNGKSGGTMIRSSGGSLVGRKSISESGSSPSPQGSDANEAPSVRDSLSKVLSERERLPSEVYAESRRKYLEQQEEHLEKARRRLMAREEEIENHRSQLSLSSSRKAGKGGARAAGKSSASVVEKTSASKEPANRKFLATAFKQRGRGQGRRSISTSAVDSDDAVVSGANQQSDASSIPLATAASTVVSESWENKKPEAASVPSATAASILVSGSTTTAMIVQPTAPIQLRGPPRGVPALQTLLGDKAWWAGKDGVFSAAPDAEEEEDFFVVLNFFALFGAPHPY